MTDKSGAGLDAALDELYGVAPSDFMATRKRLVTELRAAGDAAAAKELGSARRPTNAAWALNRLARQHADVVDRFLAQSDTLRAAQDEALSGKPDDLRTAMRAQRDALAAASQAANGVLGKGLTETFRSQIAATLQAASVDDATAEALRRGRVVREVSGATGFPDVFSASSAAAPAPSSGTKSRLPRTRDGKAGEKNERDERARARARAEAEAALASAEESLRRAEDAVATAEAAAVAASERVESLREEFDDARREARTATEAVSDARRAAKDEVKTVERLRRTETK